MKLPLVLLLSSGLLFGQGVVYIPNTDTATVRTLMNANFAWLDNNKSLGMTGTTLPTNCTIGQLFTKTNDTAGQNIYVALATGSPCTTWTKQGGAGPPADWNNITNKPSTFPPSPHASTHASGQSDAVTPAAIGAEVPLTFSSPLVRSTNTISCPTCGSGGGGSIATTSNTLKGNGAGGAVAVTGTGSNCVHVDGTSATCGTGGGASSSSGLSDCQVSASGAVATIPTPCSLTTGTVQHTLLSNATATLSGTSSSGTVFIYWDSTGTLIANEGTAATLTCANCTAATTGVIPQGAFPLASVAFSANSFGTVTDLRSVYSNNLYFCGADLSCSGLSSGGVQIDAGPTLLTKAQLQSGQTTLCTDTGAANTMTCAPATPYTGYSAGMVVQVIPLASNTGATTLSISGLAAAPVRRSDGTTALSAGDLVAGRQVPLSYDGAVFRLPSSVAGTGTGPGTVAGGTASLGTASIASGACAAPVTVAAAGVAATDTITASFNGDPTGVVGYTPSVNGMLTIIGYPTAGNVNFRTCNNTAAAITPGAITLNWRVGAATVASGTASLGTASIASGACAAAVTAPAAGVAATDTIVTTFNGDPTSAVGYVPSVSGMLTIITYPTSGNVNFRTCNNTGAAITPGAITLNWRVAR